MEKNVRSRIASQFPTATLKHNGLTLREATAKAYYDSLPLAVKTQMVNKGRDSLNRLRNDKTKKIPPVG